jgi:hypothetical protein
MTIGSSRTVAPRHHHTSTHSGANRLSIVDLEAVSQRLTRPRDEQALWRLARFATVVVTVILLAVGVWELTIVLTSMEQPNLTVGMDFGIYMDRTRDWLAGNGFYLPYQLAGPYDVTASSPPPSLYPPPLLLITVPFALGLPMLLWWVIPLGVVGWSVRRAPWWAWPLLAAILVYPRTWIAVVYGNPSMWAFAALTAGLGLMAALKPTLLPFALVGIRSRRWWRWTALAALLSLPFLAMWPDFVTVLRNAQAPSFADAVLLGEWPIAAVLLVVSRFARGR